jgi:aryl-alcohol dehydrogenase-like predicted oxidoreductase
MTTHEATAPEVSRRRIPKTDIDVFPLGLGGNVFGSTVDEQRGFEILDAFVAAGGNLIDTADSYCAFMGTDGGESETIIGNWLRSRGCRDQVVIASKVGQAPGRSDLRPQTIRAAIEGSLRRLGTDYIDIYYAHEDHGDPLDETLETFDALQRSGAVRYVAASNYSGARLAEALAESERSSWAPYVALQPLYNLLDRADYEQDLAPVVAEHGLGVFPYFSLASGYLTGKYAPGSPPVETLRLAYVEPYRTERNERIVAAVSAVATECGASCAAVALAWLASRPGVVAPLASASNVGQLEELLTMVRLRLTGVQHAALDQVSAPTPVAAS